MALSFAFGGDTGETPQTLEAKRAVAMALAKSGMTGVAHNAGEGIAKVGNALAYAMAMGNYTDAEGKAQKDYGDAITTGLGAGPMGTPAAPAAPAAPSQPQIPAAAVSGGDLTNTAQPLSGGTVAQNGSPLTEAVAKLESGNSPVNGPAGGYANYRYQQFPAFVKQYGAGEDGVVNYARQVLAANPHATFGDMYGGYVTGTGNPAAARAASLQTTTQPGAQGAFANLTRNSPIDPNTPLAQLIGNSQVASNDPNFVPHSFSSPQLAAMLSPNMTVGQPMAFNGQPPNANPLANPQAFAQNNAAPQPVGQGTFAPPSGAQPNVTNLATQPAQMPIEGQNPGRAAVAQALQARNQPQQAPAAVSGVPPQVAETIRRLSMNPLPQAQQMAAQLMQQYMKPHQYSFATLPDGTVVRQDPLGGTITPVYQANKPHFVPNASHDQYGNPVGGFVNDATGEIKLIGQNGQPVPQGGAAPAPTGDLHGEDFLKTIDPGKAETVKGIAEGRIPYPSGFIMKTPYGQWLTQAVGQYEPGIDANVITQRRKMQTDLSASSPNSMGGILSNGKSAFEHLAELSDKAVGLGSMNGYDGPGGGMAAHAGNYIGSVLGTSDTKAKIGAFNQNSLKYGQESTKFYAATGGGEAERMNSLKSLNPETSSGSEQAAFLENEKGLMLDRLRQKEAQIRAVLGDKYLQQHPVMTPELQKTINRIDGNIAKLRGGGPAAQPAAGATPKPGNYKFNPATGQLEPQ